jgi:hypothetical protein
MTDQTNQTDTTNEAQPSRIQVLKQRATLMGITFSNNIGEEALAKKIQEKRDELEKVNVQEANEAIDAGPKSLALGQDLDNLTPNERLRREQMALVRCRITNLDPKKKDLPGEVFTVANRVLGTVRKFIPYGELTEDGYHIPVVLFNELKSRKFNHTRSHRDKVTKQTVVTTKWVQEFSLEVLPPLTQEELNRLATAQIAAGSVSLTGDLA